MNSDYGRRVTCSLGIWEPSKSEAPPTSPNPHPTKGPPPQYWRVAVASGLRQGSVQLNCPVVCSSPHLQPFRDTAQSSLCVCLTTPWISGLRSNLFNSHHFFSFYMWFLWGLVHSSVWFSWWLAAKNFPREQVDFSLIQAQGESSSEELAQMWMDFSRQLVAEQSLEGYKDHCSCTVYHQSFESNWMHSLDKQKNIWTST